MENQEKSSYEKKVELFLNQKRTLDTFLERNAISKAQYEKSLGDLTKLMQMSDVLTKEIEKEKEGK